jgi:hypothetical protein
MKHPRILVTLAVLVLASFACQAFSGGQDGSAPGPADSIDSNTPEAATADPGSSRGGGNAGTSASGFPITEDAFNVIDVGDGSVLYYTHLSLEEVMGFYREVYVSQGYTERGLLTVVSDGTFSMVFDGDPSGKAVVIQSVDLGDGSRTVAVRLEDV